MNLYYDPQKFGLETVGEIDWSSGSYEFDYTVVWRRTAGGSLLYGEDSGCSCPSPFESEGVEDLTLIGSLTDFQAHLAQRNENNAYDGPRNSEIATLLERMHAAGAR
jgi:hypothetical protein